MQKFLGFDVVVLTEERSNSKAVICPERGGILLQLMLHGEEIFYLQKETFTDVTKNIRGGNPVLFPICGPLNENSYEIDGETYRMYQHGFARNKTWSVEEQSETSVTLVLHEDKETLAQYPFKFCLRFTYELADGKLTIHQSYENLSDNVMPFYAGFHPYFKGVHTQSNYSIPSEQYLDYTDGLIKKRTCEINELEIEETKLFTEVTDREASLSTESYTVHLHYSDEFNCAVLWSERPNEYICLEPWMAGPGGFDNNKGVIKLAPGKQLEASCTFSITK